MKLPLSLFLACAIPSIALLGVACGGKTSSPDSTASSQASSAGEGEKEGSAKGTSGTQESAPAPGCVHTGAGGSSGGGNGVATCMTSDSYTCATGDQTISCQCTAVNGGPWGQGSCECKGLTFAFDCADSCSIGAAEYAKCGLPAPPPDPPSNGGSSSGSSSSSSSSSSGGS